MPELSKQVEALSKEEVQALMGGMRQFLRDNGLTIALIAMFLVSALGMIFAGQSTYNQETPAARCS